MSVERDPTGAGAGEVSAVVRARTILASCHEVWCDPGHAGTARAVGMLDVGGVPYLVLSAALPWLTEGAELTGVATADDLGVLDFHAWLGRPRMLVRDRAAMQVFNEHRGCLREPPGPLDDVVVVPFGLLGARVVAPLGDALAVEVAPDAIEAVEPDWLLVHGSRVAAHLEVAHARELSELATRCGWPGAAVCIRRLSATGVALDVLTADGVTRLEMPFDPPIRQTSDLWPRLTAAVALRPRAG